MTCWKTDECPVEDSSKFTKAWNVRSAERNPTMETHFDSEVCALPLFRLLSADTRHRSVFSLPFSGTSTHAAFRGEGSCRKSYRKPQGSGWRRAFASLLCLKMRYGPIKGYRVTETKVPSGAKSSYVTRTSRKRPTAPHVLEHVGSSRPVPIMKASICRDGRFLFPTAHACLSSVRVVLSFCSSCFSCSCVERGGGHSLAVAARKT